MRILLCLIIGVFLFPLYGSSFEELGLLEQRDFVEYLRYRFVVGQKLQKPEGAWELSGLHLVQAQRLEHLRAAFETELTQEKSFSEHAIQELIKHVFDLDQAVVDWTYEFRQTIGNNPALLAQLYEQILNNLPPQESKTFENVIRRLSMEVDQELYFLQHPFLNTPPELKSVCEAIQKNPWKPNWNRTWQQTNTPSDHLRPTHWLQAKFPSYPQEATDWESIQNKVEELLLQLFSKDEIFIFKKAEEQIKDPRWVHWGVQEFEYYKLSSTPRSLFSAKLFPWFSIKIGKAILEKKYFELTEEERLELIHEIYPQPEDFMEFLSFQKTIDLFNPQTYPSLFEKLLKDALNLFQKEAVESHTFSLKNKRDKMRLWLLENPSETCGLYPCWLMDWLAVTFFPYEDYGTDEMKRFQKEWNRQELILINQQEIQNLQNAYKNSISESQKKEIESKLIKALEKFTQTIQKEAPDPNSPSVWVASFLHGLTPHHPKDLVHIAEATGVGYVFYAASRFLGGKIVGLFILGDTGLRFLSAKYFSEENLDPLDLNLEKGISTPLGRWTAETILTTAKTIHQATRPDSLHTQFQALHDLGNLSGNLVWLGAGAALAHRTIHFERISTLRSIETLERKIMKVKKQIEMKTAEIAQLSQEIQRLESQLPKLEKAFGKNHPEYLKQAALLAEKRFQKNVKISGHPQALETTLEFYSKKLVGFIARLLNPLFFIKKPHVAKTWNHWMWRLKKSEWLGLEQYQGYVRFLEADMATVKTGAFLKEARPASFKNAFSFDHHFKQFQAQQRVVAHALHEIGILLEHPSFATQEAQLALQSFEKALNAFSGQSQNIVDLIRFRKNTLTHFQQLENLSEPPAFLSWQERGWWKIENLKRKLLGKESLPSLLPDEHTRQFLERQKILLQEQRELLKNVFQALQDKIHEKNLFSDSKILERTKKIERILL